MKHRAESKIPSYISHEINHWHFTVPIGIVEYSIKTTNQNNQAQMSRGQYCN